MDYQTASGLRKRSLSDLITQRLLQTTTTLPTSEGGRPTTSRDYSIGGAITSSIGEKFKASVTGLQQTFDPLNIVRILTGGSSLAPALFGRMTGRKMSSIDYFSGKGKTKRAGRKDPDYSSIGDGASAKLRVGDSYSDVLAKMFLYLKNAQEFDKLSYELEKNFREEQVAEDERRHKRLVDAILGARKGGKPAAGKEDNTESFLEKLMDKMQSIISAIWSSVKFLASTASGIISGVTKMIGGMKDKLIGAMVSMSTFIVKKMLKIAFLALLDGLAMVTGPIGKAIATSAGAALAAAGIIETKESYQKAVREAYGGMEAEETFQEIQKYESSGSGMNFTGEPTEEALQKIKELTDKRNQQILDYQNKYMDPSMSKLGWTKQGYERDASGNLLYDKPIYTKMENGKEVRAGILQTPEILSAGVGSNVTKGMDFTDAFRAQQEQLDRFLTPVETPTNVEKTPDQKVEFSQSASALAPMASTTSYSVASPTDIASKLVSPQVDVVVTAKRPVVANKTNIIGGQKETFKSGESVSVRDSSRSLKHALEGSVFAK